MVNARINKLKKWFFIVSLILLSNLLLWSFSLAQTIADITYLVHTPTELSILLSQEFRYETEIPDYWQSAKETLNLKKGDCEDFAILSQTILKSLGIASDILMIKFKGLNQLHAICIFKSGKYYSFFSNQKLIHTKACSIKETLEEQYPDWEKIILTNEKKQNLKIVIKDNYKHSLENEFMVSSNIR